MEDSKNCQYRKRLSNPGGMLEITFDGLKLIVVTRPTLAPMTAVYPLSSASRRSLAIRHPKSARSSASPALCNG